MPGGRPSALTRFVEQVSQLIWLQDHMPIRLRFVIRWIESDFRYPFVAVNGSRPTLPSSPMEAMVTGNDRQFAGAGMTANEFFQQFVCLAATRREVNPDSVLCRRTWQTWRCVAGIKDNRCSLSLGVAQNLPEPIQQCFPRTL